MPTIRNIPGPHRFYFYSFDCNEPMHVHVERDRSTCKFWLDPLSLASNFSFAPHELNRIRKRIDANRSKIIDAWKEHCAQA